MNGPRTIARAAFESVDKLFDKAFTPAWNPLYHLGTLGWFFYWIVIVSGIYLYIFFDTGVTQAYESLKYITNVQWYAGGVMRSLHRYASDALIIVMMLHLVREFVMDRYRGARWFSWFTGVPLIWLVFASGIRLGIFGQAIARNFLNEETLSGRFFTLMVFIHIAVPLFLLLVMWIHIQRQRDAKVNPPVGLAVGTLGMLLVLSFIEPAVSQPPANLNIVPTVIDFDWFYLMGYPLLDRMSGIAVWAVAGGGTLFLAMLPWLPPKRHRAAAVVDLDNCNGCGRCVDDCPFTAISLQPRTDETAFDEEAVVSDDLCISCGICVGSCPTSTPYRRSGQLVPGINLPDTDLHELREQILTATDRLTGSARIIVFGCDHGPDLKRLCGPDTAIMKLPCIAMLPPSFIDYLLSRKHTDGIFLTGCAEGDCHYRLGQQWEEQRLAGKRDPYLRARVPRERVGTFWAGVSRNRQLLTKLGLFRDSLQELPAVERKKKWSSTKELVTNGDENHDE